jgi:RND family efflux transporter MFP subunit
LTSYGAERLEFNGPSRSGCRQYDGKRYCPSLDIEKALVAFVFKKGRTGRATYREDHVRHGIISLCLAFLLDAGAADIALAQTPAAPAVTVSAPLQQEIVEWDEFTGQFAAIDFVEIRARVNGYLTELHFQDGQIVHKGDLLFVIDPRPYEAALASAQAQLAQGQAQVDLAQRQLGRSSELLQRGWEPQSTTDQRVSDLKVAQASVQTAQAAIQTAQLNVEFTHITAPITGRISNHRVSVGNLVTGGDAGSATLLTTVVSLDPIYFYFDINEAEFLAYQRAIAKGNLQDARAGLLPAELHLTDEQGWPHQGKINFVDNQVDRGAGTIRVRAVFDNPNLLFTVRPRSATRPS